MQSIPGYPFDADKDSGFLQDKSKDYPDVDILSLLKNWKVYLLDKPLKKNASPRSQLDNQFKFALKFGKHRKAARITENAPAENMLEIIKAAEKELEMETTAAGELI